jgi:hypothetical protein
VPDPRQRKIAPVTCAWSIAKNRCDSGNSKREIGQLEVICSTVNGCGNLRFAWQWQTHIQVVNLYVCLIAREL